MVSTGLSPYAAEPTPHNAINEKAIVDAEAVGEAIRRAVKRSGAKSRLARHRDQRRCGRSRKSFKCPRVSVRTSSRVRSRCRRTSTFPFPMEEVSYDYQVVGPLRERSGTCWMSCWLRRVRRTSSSARRAVQASGLTAHIVDVEAFRSGKRLYSDASPDARRGHGTVPWRWSIFGASSTTFSVLRDMKVIYTRDFRLRRPATDRGNHAYLWASPWRRQARAKKEGGLPSNYQPEVLDPFIDDMTQQVSRSLQFYLASGSGPVANRTKY